MAKKTKKEASPQVIWDILREVSVSQDKLTESQDKFTKGMEDLPG